MIEIPAAIGAALQHHRAGRLAQAEAIYREVLREAPGHPDALHLLGMLAHQAQRDDLAIELIRQAICGNPDPVFCNNLGTIYRKLGRVDEAVGCYRQGLASHPGFAELHNNLGNALKDQGRIDEAIACYRQALLQQPDYPEACSNLLYAMHCSPAIPAATLSAEYFRFAERFEAPLRSGWQRHRNSPEPERQLKLGYVSADFREHALAHFIEPVLEHHDRSGYQVFCYDNHGVRDEFTGRMESHADVWVPCAGLSDEQLAGRIRADGIDILIDLSGHTARNRLLAFARKPAPVQLTCLGYVGTTGLSAIGYRLSHIDADPPGSEAFYSEALYRFSEHLWWCYRPRPGMPQVAPPPLLTNGFVTFASTNNFAKLTPEVLGLWAGILRRLEHSRLLVAGVPEGSANERLIRQFGELGIDESRLIIRPMLQADEFLELYRQIDIVLDPFPYNGGTTTCDALWMGVPVVSLIGESFVSRMGYAMLKNIGLADLAATTVQQYADIALDLASDPVRLAALRAGMRARLEASPLRDEIGFTRGLESAYRGMWRSWCEDNHR